MQAIKWPATMGIGFLMMLTSYFAWERVSPDAPWSTGRLFVRLPDSPGDETAVDIEHIQARLRLLPTDGFTAALLDSVGAQNPRIRRRIELQLREKLIELSPDGAAIDQRLLAGGRLPVAGRNEVLAGCRAVEKSELEVAGHKLTIVGVLRREVALFAETYLIPPDDSLNDVFDLKDESVRDARLIGTVQRNVGDPEVRRRLASAFPPDRFAAYDAVCRNERGAYYLYLAGQALLLVGGTGCLIGLYGGLERRIQWQPLHAPLEVLSHRRRLMWTMHLAYFGVTIVGAILIYDLPAVQSLFLASVGDELTSGGGPLAHAAKAYGTGNIVRAAAATFAINFFLGTLAMITIPSLMVPGAGVLVAEFRAALWGLLLAPTTTALSSSMLPHTWTLLLEGEGYILAAFFATLLPLSLFSRGGDERLGGRYGRACIVCLQGSLLVAFVLFVAACYEAVEVITLARPIAGPH